MALALTLFAACKNSKVDDLKDEETHEKVIDNTLGDSATLAENGVSQSESEQETALQQNEDESYTLRYNLKKGETYPFELKINQEQKVSAMGQSASIKTSRTVVFDYFVEDISNGQFILRADFKKFSESFSSPEGTISYDTSGAKPSDKDAAENWLIYKAISGQSFQLTMNNKGKVISVKGLDKVISNSMAKLKNDFDEETRNGIKQMLEFSLSNEAIISQFEESLNIFPDKGLKIGEKWEDSQNINEGPIKGQSKVSRTFESIKDGKATISVSGTQNVSGSDTDSQSGITAKMKNNATLTGSVDLDLETGWIKKAKITQTENITTTYSQGDRSETETGTQTIVTTVN